MSATNNKYIHQWFITFTKTYTYKNTHNHVYIYINIHTHIHASTQAIHIQLYIDFKCLTMECQIRHLFSAKCIPLAIFPTINQTNIITSLSWHILLLIECILYSNWLIRLLPAISIASSISLSLFVISYMIHIYQVISDITWKIILPRKAYFPLFHRLCELVIELCILKCVCWIQAALNQIYLIIPWYSYPNSIFIIFGTHLMQDRFTYGPNKWLEVTCIIIVREKHIIPRLWHKRNFKQRQYFLIRHYAKMWIENVKSHILLFVCMIAMHICKNSLNILMMWHNSARTHARTPARTPAFTSKYSLIFPDLKKQDSFWIYFIFTFR